MNELEKKSNYEEMRRGEALQTLLASNGGEILKELLLSQYHDAFNALMDNHQDKEECLMKMRVIQKLMRDIKGNIDFGELAKKRLADYANKQSIGVM